MLWIILILGVIVAAFAIPRFRKVVLGLLLALVVLVVIGALALFVSNQRQRDEREAAKGRIQRSEIELVDLRLTSGYGSSRTLVGRVRNQSSRYTLSEIKLRLTMKDCVDANRCEIVGQTEETMYISVPPGQARDLDEYVYFSGLGTPRGKHQWDYEVVEVLGK